MSLGCFTGPFLGFPIGVPINRSRNGNLAMFSRGKWNNRAPGFSLLNQNQKRQKRLDFLQFGLGYVKFPIKKLVSTKDPFKTSCMKGPSPQHMALVRYLSPLWKEGLLMFRYSVLIAILSAAIMLVWYGQRQASKFVEARLLPSVCSMLSQSVQRELDFGKVQSISPLGITLHSCSIGSRSEEFSCGQFPRMKLRFKPFASLRRGKVVIDAVLLRPNILIAQKEDFSWLGIPLPSEDDLKRHSSSEEGIDLRTKTRRLAREKASANWYEERKNAARKAAELGYIVPPEHECSAKLLTADCRDAPLLSHHAGNTGSFFNINSGKLLKDCHSVDVGMDCDLKHGELEESFGINVPMKRFKVWPKIISSPKKGKFKRESHRKMLDEDRVTFKRRNLECSAKAALAYFRGLNVSGDSPASAQVSLLNGGSESASGGKSDIASSSTKDHENFGTSTKSTETSNRNDILKAIPNVVSNKCGVSEDFVAPCAAESIADEDRQESPKHLYTMKDHVGNKQPDQVNAASEPLITTKRELDMLKVPMQSSWIAHVPDKDNISKTGKLEPFGIKTEQHEQIQIVETHDRSDIISDDSQERVVELSGSGPQVRGSKCQGNSLGQTENDVKMPDSTGFQPLDIELEVRSLCSLARALADYLIGQIQKLKSYIKREYLSLNFIEREDLLQSKDIKTFPVELESIYFTEGTLMLLAYGDQEPREMDSVDGHVKFHNHYSRINVKLSGDCREWRSNGAVKDGGQLVADVFVDILDQKWHANLELRNLSAPLFERILELPITWSKGSATGRVHICMSEGESFPNISGQLDVRDLAFHILEAPSSFSDVTASLGFQGQSILLRNASGKFGDAKLEASGEFGINPEDGEFNMMCQVPSVEVNHLMKTLKMKPLLFSLAGSVTAVFNCQGPLDAPIFVGSGIISRKTPHLASVFPPSPASEAVNKNREAGAVAAFDHIPLSHVSANFTFNTDNCVADLYGMRAALLDGGEIRGAGTAWICSEGEEDDSALDINVSGNCIFDRVISRYLPSVSTTPLKIGELNGEAKLSGPLLKPRFDIKWCAPMAEESFTDARGDIVITHDYITVNSSSVAFDLYMRVQTSYRQDYLDDINYTKYSKMVPLIVEGLDVDLRLCGFDFSSMILSNPFDVTQPVHLKATGKIKFQGKVVELETISNGSMVESKVSMNNQTTKSLLGEISLSGVKLNQLMVAPQLTGSLTFSRERIQLDATGRPDESMFIEVVGPLWPVNEEILQNRACSFCVSLQRGQLRASINYQPQNQAKLEVRHLPLDELELASLRGMIQRAEIQLNFQKRRGHGLLSAVHPKFSGVLGEALDVVARWSGDVITIEKTILEQASSRYMLQGEYVLPRDRYSNKAKDGIFKKAMDRNLGSLISSMGRWRMRLEVPVAEVSEMLPLARLLSRSIDPSVRSRSKDLFMLSVQSMGFCAGGLRELLEAVRRSNDWSDGVAMGEIALPGLGELKGRWRGSLDASGGGDGDTLAEFDFRGEDWEWGTYRTQRVLAVGAYSNNDGLRLDNMFIQKGNATLHADGTVLGPISNLHFAVLNFPIGLLPKVMQVIDSSTMESLGSLWQFLAPLKGILHMEGDLRGTLARPECDVQVRLLDGAIGGIDLKRAEVVASTTPTSRFLFNANFEPVSQSGRVHIQGSVPVTYIQDDALEDESNNIDSDRTLITSGWAKESIKELSEDNDKRSVRDRSEDGWGTQLAESLKDLNWNLLGDEEVKVDADIKDGGMMLLTAMCPYADWLNGHADINLQVRGTVKQPIFDGSASFHRASVYSPLLQKPLTNFGGTILVKANRLCIISMESRVGKGKLGIKGNLPLKTTESSSGDKIDMKCEILEVRAKHIFSGQVDNHIQIVGSILQPNISGRIKLSHGEAYLPHDKGNGDVINRLAARKPSFSAGGFGQLATSGHVSHFFGSQPTPPPNKQSRHSAKEAEVEEAIDQVNVKPRLDVRLTDLRFFLGPELRIVYPLILNFAVSGCLELNGSAHPKLIRPKGVLTFENGEINLVATQARLKRDHLNVAKFEPEVGLDPMLDLALVGSEWQFRIQGPASKWQDNLMVTSTRSVDQDVLSPSEAAKIFESQLAESLLERDGQLAFKKLATATLATLMPKIEGKGEFGQARWRLVYAPQIPSLLAVDPTVDPLKSLANNLSVGTEVEVQLGKRLQASVVRQMKDSETAVQWTLIYQLTSRLRVLFQSSPATRLLFEYTATSQD